MIDITSNFRIMTECQYIVLSFTCYGDGLHILIISREYYSFFVYQQDEIENLIHYLYSKISHKLYECLRV